MIKYIATLSFILVMFLFQNCGDFSSIQRRPSSDLLSISSVGGAGSSPSVSSLGGSKKEFYQRGRSVSLWKCAFSLHNDNYQWNVERFYATDDDCKSAVSTVRTNNPLATIVGPEKLLVTYHDDGTEVLKRTKCEFLTQASNGSKQKVERVLDRDDSCASIREFVTANNAKILSERKVTMKFDASGRVPNYYWRCDHQLTDKSGKVSYLESYSVVKDEGCEKTTKDLKSTSKDSSVKSTGNAFVHFEANILPAKAPVCSASKINEVLSSGPGQVSIQCSLKLTRAYQISKALMIEGSEASGITVDLAGSSIGSSERAAQIQVRSKESDLGGSKLWSVPTNVTIKNGAIYGYFGATYRDNFWSESNLTEQAGISRLADYTQIVQKRAPSNISVSNMDFYGVAEGIPVFIYTGVTDVKLYNSQYIGAAKLAIYLADETKGNMIKNNIFNIKTGRELIAVDGSAANVISGNKFLNLNGGGIKIYRNCGENGVVRHLKPTHNNISDNFFDESKKPDIVLASRQGLSGFCPLDKDARYGSGIDDMDFAQFNKVSDNRFYKRDPVIIDNDINNTIVGNVKVNTRD